MSKFADRLYYLRTENKLTQEGLCEILKEKYNVETNKSMISKYEKGIHEPAFTFIDYVADYFGVTTDWLMGRSDNKYYSDNTEGKKIPVLKDISYKFQLLSPENINAYEYTSGDADFCIRVFDDNMSGSGINIGNLAFIRKQSILENENVGLFIVDGKPGIYRFIKEDAFIVLKSDNSSYNPLIFTNKDFKQVIIIGRVISIKIEL